MPEYIEREAVRPDAFCVGVSCQEYPFLKDPVKGECRVDDFILSLPAADVAPVVKCNDCKYRQDNDYCGGRGWPAQLVQDDGYCDKGKRKDGDGE